MQVLWDRGEREKLRIEWQREIHNNEACLLKNGMQDENSRVAAIVRTSFSCDELAEAVLVERFTFRAASGNTYQVQAFSEYRLLATPEAKSPFTWEYVRGKAVPLERLLPEIVR